MNVITFNKRISDDINKLTLDIDNISIPDEMRSSLIAPGTDWKKSPALSLKHDMDDELPNGERREIIDAVTFTGNRSQVGYVDHTNMVNMPFKSTKALISGYSKSKPQESIRVFCRTDGERQVGCISGSPFFTRIGFCLTPRGYRSYMILSKTERMNLESQLDEGEMNSFPNTVTVSMLSLLSYYYTAPGFYRAKVYPDKKGKSIEWSENRSYITIVDRKHPANVKSVKEGQSVNYTAIDSKRSAHHRRAHMRLLTSPKFKKKRGQYVFVKSSWCGPQEWKQGNHLYKIVK